MHIFISLQRPSPTSRGFVPPQSSRSLCLSGSRLRPDRVKGERHCGGKWRLVGKGAMAEGREEQPGGGSGLWPGRRRVGGRGRLGIEIMGADGLTD